MGAIAVIELTCTVCDEKLRIEYQNLFYPNFQLPHTPQNIMQALRGRGIRGWILDRVGERCPRCNEANLSACRTRR